MSICSHLALSVSLAWIALLCASSGCRQRPEIKSPAPQTLALIERAERAESQRDYLRAQTLYAQAKDTAPDETSRAHAARTYGRALNFYGEHERAATQLSEASELEPRDAGTWHDLGIARNALGDPTGAERALRRSVDLAPDDGRSRIALAAVLMNQKRYRDALAEYRALSSVDLPRRVRAQVEWAIDALEKHLAPGPVQPTTP